MYRKLRPLLFRLDPETAHSFTISLLRIAGVTPGLRRVIQASYRGLERPVDVFGLRFKNPIGLAAGYDKDGIAWRGLSLLGFSHIEIGTVTPRPQSGNPRPRIFRLVEDEALINRLGFPSRGSDFVVKKIIGPRPSDLVLGVNLGKNADTPFNSAIDDYLKLFKCFAGLADYLVINISSPNTVGLRRLQARHELDKLLKRLAETRQDKNKRLSSKIPLLVKLSPDLSASQLEDALDVIIEYGIDGVVATNTTVRRDNLNSSYFNLAGGLSGKPITSRSTDVIQKIYQYTSGKLPIIGVGGVMQPADARAKLDAGAKLVQVYTGLVYAGPSLVKNILAALSD